MGIWRQATISLVSVKAASNQTGISCLATYNQDLIDYPAKANTFIYRFFNRETSIKQQTERFPARDTVNLSFYQMQFIPFFIASFQEYERASTFHGGSSALRVDLSLAAE